MRGFSFQKNTAFEWAKTAYRIQALPPDGNVLLEVVATGNLLLKPKDELLSAYTRGELSFMENASVRPSGVVPFSRPLEDLSPQVRQEYERRWRYLNALKESGLPSVCTRKLASFIARVASEIGDAKPPSPITLYRWTVRFRMTDDARALIPRHDRRGSRTTRLSQQVIALLESAVNEAFAQSPAATAKMIYARLATAIERENLRRFEHERLTTPSLRTVHRMLNRMDAYERSVLKAGKAATERKFRLVLSGTKTTRPLERVEIDHTPLDLFCIDSTTWLPLGRPTLTVAIDVFSRYPVGYYISFGAPSSSALIGVLRHAILPKTLTTAPLPKLPIEHAWPCFGTPEKIVVDNGLEFHGTDLEAVALDLKMTIEFCPKREPRFKGTIERFLKTTNYYFAHQLPGTSLARLHERGDYDPLRHALLTFDELKQVLEKWIVDDYAETVHRGTQMPPRALWEQGVLAHPPQLPANRHTLHRRIGKSAQRALRPYGIELNGIRYNSASLAPILRRHGERVKVKINFDTDDLGEILVWGPEDEDPTIVPALNQDYARGLTEYQNEFIRAQLRERGRAASDRNAVIRARAELAQQIQELMGSRKLRARKQSARLRGLSSSKPASPIEPSADPAPKLRAKSLRDSAGEHTNVLPLLLPKIDIDDGGGKPC